MHIKKTCSLKEVLKDLREKTLVVLDLDNTLIECKTSFGSYYWIVHHIKEAVQKGEELDDALRRLVPKWEELQKYLEMKKIEEDSASLLDHLKDQGHLLLGLTGRSSLITKETLAQLEKNQLYFSSWPEKDFFSSFNEVSMQKGVVFVGPYLSKGEVLAHFLHQVEEDFEQLIFVDDSLDYLKEVHQALASFQRPYTCYHYRAVAERAHAFDYQKAVEEEKQLFNLQKPAEQDE